MRTSGRKKGAEITACGVGRGTLLPAGFGEDSDESGRRGLMRRRA